MIRANATRFLDFFVSEKSFVSDTIPAFIGIFVDIRLEFLPHPLHSGFVMRVGRTNEIGELSANFTHENLKIAIHLVGVLLR